MGQIRNCRVWLFYCKVLGTLSGEAKAVKMPQMDQCYKSVLACALQFCRHTLIEIYIDVLYKICKLKPFHKVGFMSSHSQFSFKANLKLIFKDDKP